MKTDVAKPDSKEFTAPTHYAIGSDEFPGVGKLIEEIGETLQVIGKIMAIAEMGEHWDGKAPLKIRLEHELADMLAAVEFLREVNGLDWPRMQSRLLSKLTRFRKWHKQQMRRK